MIPDVPKINIRHHSIPSVCFQFSTKIVAELDTADLQLLEIEVLLAPLLIQVHSIHKVARIGAIVQRKKGAGELRHLGVWEAASAVFQICFWPWI